MIKRRELILLGGSDFRRGDGSRHAYVLFFLNMTAGRTQSP
jgi:hypothetical protein